MARYKHYNYSQLMMVPVCLDEQLMPGTLEHTIHALIENEIDLSVFDARYNNDETGCTAYDPRVLLKPVLLGYARGLLSSRKIEAACRENIIFMALTCGRAPDHSTLAAFVSTMENEIKLIFRDILLYCEKKELLGGTCFSIDGCKLPGNASKSMSGTFEQLEQKKERLEKRLDELIKEHQDNDAPAKAAEVEKRIDRLDQFLKNNEPKPGRKHKENKSNVIDNDSQLMPTSHGVIQGYNAQAAVDSKHQIIVFADAGNSGQDDEHLLTVVDGVKENLKAVGRGDDCLKQADMLSDANYFSPTNLKKLMDEGINCCIPDKDFRKRDPRFIDGEPMFSIADFHYDPERDVYICPAGKKLSRRSDTKRDGEKYYRQYAADEKSCQACEQRRRCLALETSKRRCLSVCYDKPLAEYVRTMMEKMASDEGRRKYDERFGMVEPVFANIRTQKRMDRFTLRGKRKVNIQWMLYCLVHNIEKCIPFDTEMTLIAA